MNRRKIAAVYGALLTGFSAYVLLDTFVLAKNAQTGANEPMNPPMQFAGQPQNYQPLFNNNGQVTGQTGSFQAIPQNQAMVTDDHGVPGFLKRKK